MYILVINVSNMRFIMVQLIDLNKSLGEIVAIYPATRKVFDEFNLDYCCGGKQEVLQAALDNNVSIELLKERLNQALNEAHITNSQQQNFVNESMTTLVNYIEEKHHAFMKEKLPYDSMLLEKLENVHKEKYSDFLVPLKKTFTTLKNELEQHLWIEENTLFPYLRELDDYLTGKSSKRCLPEFNLSQMIEQMEKEHNNAGDALKIMRELTNNYTLPEEFCQTFVVVYNDLQAIEDDLHQHVHLENTVLFPKALTTITNAI